MSHTKLTSWQRELYFLLRDSKDYPNGKGKTRFAGKADAPPELALAARARGCNLDTLADQWREHGKGNRSVLDELRYLGYPRNILWEFGDRSPPNLPTDFYPAVLEHHARGHTPVEIASIVGTSRGTVYRILRARVLRPHPSIGRAPTITAQQRDRIIKASETDESWQSIATRLGLTHDQVRYALRKEKVSNG